MYTLKLLAPFIVGTCVNDLTSTNAVLCDINPPKAVPVKFYESGKSCYVNGVFYRNCDENNNRR